MHYKAIKTKLKLNNCQATLMAKHAGFARWIFNWGLRLWSEAYKEGVKPSANTLKKLFTNHVKPQYAWISELSSRVYQYAFLALGDAFKRFLKKLGGYPKFKRKGLDDSFTIDNCGKPIKIGGLQHKLPFIGWVRTHEALPSCVTKKVTISKQAGDWYFSFHVEMPDIDPTVKTVDVVGVDLGISALATLSSGIVFPNLKPYRQAKQKLVRLQRAVSRKIKDSNNRKKAVLKLARQHRQVATIRNDAIHKITSYLAKNHSRIVIEDLNVVGLLKNHKLAGAIADCGLSEFRRQLEYKCSRYGSELLIADRFYPSSQLCSCCGYKQKMPLNVRVYECVNCGLSIDRDLNAAINLCNWGRLVPGSLLTVNRSHAPVEAESKPQCSDLSDLVSVL
jgi:putative transposase